VKSRLIEDKRHHITYSEYTEICESYGLSEVEAREYMQALHHSGVVFHFQDNNNLKDYIFLKPETVTSALTSQLGIKFHTRSIPELQSELTSLLKKFEYLNTRKLELDDTAHKKSKNFMHVGIVYLFIQSGVLGYMVWIAYSWGTMEPVTYFVFLTTLIGGLFFFLSFRMKSSRIMR